MPKTHSIQFLRSLGFFPYQVAWLRDTSQFKIGLWSRQTGKDYTCAAEGTTGTWRAAEGVVTESTFSAKLTLSVGGDPTCNALAAIGGFKP